MVMGKSDSHPIYISNSDTIHRDISVSTHGSSNSMKIFTSGNGVYEVIDRLSDTAAHLASFSVQERRSNAITHGC